MAADYTIGVPEGEFSIIPLTYLTQRTLAQLNTRRRNVIIPFRRTISDFQ